MDPSEFGDIIVKVAPGGPAAAQAAQALAMQATGGAPWVETAASQPPAQTTAVVHLRDVVTAAHTIKDESGNDQAVGGVQLGSLQYDQTATLDGQPTVALSVYGLPGANALETADAVRKRMGELQKRFPEGLEYRIVYDTTPFIRESVNEVYLTLLIAVVLVAVVVLAFLQSWRAAVIPLVAVPVAVFGTFAVMAAAGYSLNTLTLFGLVLAIGIVVDDAIVVVENVERWLEQGLAPHEATRRAWTK